jgi:hypothetical protein
VDRGDSSRLTATLTFTVTVSYSCLMYILYQCTNRKFKRVASSFIGPMPSQNISRRQKLDALNLVAQGSSRQDVVDSTGLSHSTLYRTIKKQRVYGNIDAPHKKTGRKPKISQPIIDVPSFQHSLIAYYIRSCSVL